jgi:hypothetical protein
MKPIAADVDHGMAVVEDAAGHDAAQEQVVIAHRPATRDLAMQIRQRFAQD